jgi:hypothetical protein
MGTLSEPLSHDRDHLTSTSGEGLQVAVIDVAGEVEHDAFGVHAERGGDELGVDGVDQAGEPGAAQCPGRDAAAVQHVAGIGG